MNLANCRTFGAAWAGAFCLFWLAGCSHSITVEGRVPTPLIDPLPVSIGVITQPSFNQYVHSEKLPRGGGNWQIEVGELNQTFFKTLFSAMFEEAVDAVIRERSDFIEERGMGAVGPLMGMVMQKLGGSADGKAVSKILRDRIDEKIR